MGGNCKVKKNDFMHDVCGVEGRPTTQKYRNGILSLPFLFRPNMLMLWTFFKKILMIKIVHYEEMSASQLVTPKLILSKNRLL